MLQLNKQDESTQEINTQERLKRVEGGSILRNVAQWEGGGGG